MTTTKVPFKHRLSGLFPREDWPNPTRHISALVKGGKIITYGESSLGGKPYFSPIRGRSCHSEMSVLKYISSKLGNKRKVRKYVLWNVRWTRDGKLANSKPCFHCQQVLLNVGINKIVFSTNEGEFIKTNISNLVCKPSSGFRF